MHELGIVFHIIKNLEKVGEEERLEKVSTVTLEIGEVSTVIGSYLEDCWNWAVKRSVLLEGAQLRIESIPAVTYCEDCGRTYPTVEYGRICPHCESEHTYLVSGNEVNIKEIEAC